MTANGCGPAWMPERLKKLLFNWFHEASCNRHDWGYTVGGNSKRRKVCDEKFLEAMLRDADRLPRFKRKVAIAQAHIFYRMVRMFGYSRFNYHGEL